MPLPNMTPAQLLAAALVVHARTPDAELVKNEVGNLAIVRGGEFIGYIDLRYGDVDYTEDDDIIPAGSGS